MIPFMAMLVVACSSANKPSPVAEPVAEPPPPPPPPAADAVAPPDASRPIAQTLCLPVVAAECNCVYSCGVGILQPNGDYLVEHTFWKATKLKAKVNQWCVKGKCTDAFHAEIICDGICVPRPADPTCHFEGNTCVSKQKPKP